MCVTILDKIQFDLDYHLNGIHDWLHVWCTCCQLDVQLRLRNWSLLLLLSCKAHNYCQARQNKQSFMRPRQFIFAFFSLDLCIYQSIKKFTGAIQVHTRELSIHTIVNHKSSFVECLRVLDACDSRSWIHEQDLGVRNQANE